MKELGLNIEGQILTKGEMKNVVGGYECYYWTGGQIIQIEALAPNPDSAQSLCDAVCWGDPSCDTCTCFDF